MESSLSSKIRKLLQSAKSTHGNTPVFFSFDQDSLHTAICAENIRKDIELNQKALSEFFDEDLTVTRLEKINKEEKEMRKVIRELLDSVDAKKWRERDEEMKAAESHIDVFLNSVKIDLKLFIQPTRKYLVEVAFGSDLYEEFDSLKKKVMEAFSLEEEIANASPSGLSNREVLEILGKHLNNQRLEELKDLKKQVEYNVATCLDQNMELKRSDFENAKSSIRKAVHEMLGSIKKAVQSAQKISELKIPKNFTNFNENVCAISPDNRFFYCKGTRKGCVGFGDYPGTVWGTGPFCNGSCYCLAGAFAGVIDRPNGGVFKVRPVGNVPNFVSGSRNGVNATSYGPYDGYEVEKVETDEIEDPEIDKTIKRILG